MSKRQDAYRRLLDDVLQDEDYRQFQDGLRELGLQQIRTRTRRRRRVMVAAAVGLVVVLALLPLLLARSGTPRPSPVFDEAPLASVQIVRPQEASVTVQIISDDELIALFGGRPCGLIEIAPGRQRLWVYDPDNEFGPTNLD